ncbi:type VII secretion-associated protein [Pseudonocardia sp. DR1-2]|uniref:type VII secretion-associated protein n=1 Tax=Pseudonocardia sp. DR1-2 TaxID=2951168 RepID=UPI0020441426|nr:type VII secretion-associated protein [Pseudonocardia sp. DR1-2]MCM3846898.1 type VII secretion-associated protein [Pseudonocardia sp. DR1-2]
MSGVAVAVHDRRDAVLLAAADAAGLRLVAAAPPGTPPATAVADFFGDEPPGVVVRVGTTAGGAFPGGPRVLVVPAAVAVLAAEPELPDGPVLVVDDDVVLVRDGVPERVGERGTDLACLVRATGAELVVVAGTVGPLPGEHSAADTRAADTRTAGTRATGTRAAGRPGGLPGYRLPCPVRVAGRRPAGGEPWGPEAAAVVGAAVLGASVLADPGPDTVVPPPGAGETPEEPDRPGPATPPAEGPDRARAAIVVAGVLGAVLLGTGLLLGGPRPVSPAGATVAQYGYAAALPTGWEHTGGDPQRRRVLLTPAGGPDGADLLVLERSPLGYDAGREPDRARRELAALVGDPGPVPATVGGRAVLRWTETPGDGTVVDWHVVFSGTDELVAGCRRPVGAPVAVACAEVVATLHRVP